MRLELEVGAPAHGGCCVARHEGRVVFVRHALPGERVRAQVTEDRGGGYCRADAVEILQPSPDRVSAPCPRAGPGRCGGCDWQHASGAAQRELKTEVVRAAFRRFAGLDLAGLWTGVEALPGGLLGWRTRITFAVDDNGVPGLHRHRSHAVEAVPTCPLGAPGVGDSAVLQRRWPGLTAVEVVRGDDGACTVLGHRAGPGRQARGRRPPDRIEVLDGPLRIRHQVGERTLETAAEGFWQVHPAAVPTFAAALLDLIKPRAGETVLELYCGAGALTVPLARAVGPTGNVLGVESAAQAVQDATENLRELPWAQVRRGRVDVATLAGLAAEPDLIVLDPPRAGAGRDVLAALLALAPRAIGYLACDPVALARDVRLASDAGWRLARLRAFDAFPMTHHVECLALLLPGAPR